MNENSETWETGKGVSGRPDWQLSGCQPSELVCSSTKLISQTFNPENCCYLPFPLHGETSPFREIKLPQSDIRLRYVSIFLIGTIVTQVYVNLVLFIMVLNVS